MITAIAIAQDKHMCKFLSSKASTYARHIKRGYGTYVNEPYKYIDISYCLYLTMNSCMVHRFLFVHYNIIIFGF